MANNPVATMTARVQIDKQSVMDDFLKDIKDVQKVADGNAIVYKLKANKDSLKDVLKQIADAKFEIDTDIVIKSRSKDIQAQINHLFKDTPTLNVETKVDTESIKELDNQIDSVSKSIDAAKKKLEQISKVSSIESIREEILVADKAIKELEETGKTSGKNYENSVKHVLDLVKTLKDLGGSLPKGFDRRTVQMYQNFLPKYKPQSLVVDSSEIKEQESLIESLTNQLTELTAQKEKMVQAGTSASNGKGLADSLNKESAEIKDAASNLEKAAGELEQASNKYDDILNKSYATSGKREATSQLKAAYEEYMKFFNADNGLEKDAIVRNMSDAGREAAYSYYKALEEALRQGISQNSLEKYFALDLDDRIISKNISDKARLDELKYNFSHFTEFIQEQARITREVQFIDTEQTREALKIYMDEWDLWRARSDDFTDLDSTKDEQEWTENAKQNLIEVIALEKEMIEKKKQASAEDFIDEKTIESAKETASALDKANEEIKEEGVIAEKAAEQKEKFVKANEDVAQSGEKTEAQVLNVADSIKQENKVLEETIDLMAILDNFQGIKDEYNLGSVFEDVLKAEMAIADFQKIAPAIAAAYNEQNKTSITAAQVVKAYKASQKEIAKADEQRIQEENQRYKNQLNVYESETRKKIEQMKKQQAEAEKEQKDLERLPIDVQKEIAQLDKIIAKSEEYGSATEEVTQKLKDQRTLLKTRNDRDTLNDAKNVRELNTALLDRLVIEKDLAKTSSLDSMGEKIGNLEDFILNDERLFKRFNETVIEVRDNLSKIGTNTGLEQLSPRVNQLTKEIEKEANALKKADAEQKKKEEAAHKKYEAATNAAALQEETEWNKKAIAAYNSLTQKAETYYEYKKKKANGTLTETERVELERLTQEWLDAAKAVGKYTTASGNAKSVRDLESAREKFSQSDRDVAIGYAQNYATTAKKFSAAAESDKYTSKLSNTLKDIADKIKVLNKTPIDLNVEGTIENLAELDKAINEAKESMRLETFRKAQEASIAKLNLKIEKFMHDNSAMGRQFREQFENLKLDWDAEHSYEELRKLAAAFITLEAKVEEARMTGKSFFDTLNERITGLNAQFLARYFSWEDWIRYLRTIAQNIVQIDTDLTELRKVSDATSERLQQSFEKSAQSAQELGSSISDVIEVTSDWARLGYNVDQAEELARVTTLFKTVGDNMSAEDASSYLVSTMQGFQLAADQAESIVDKYNEVDSCLQS